MSAPANASSAPPPSSLPINKDKGALTMLVKPAAPGADLAALAAQIRGLEVRGVRWAQQFGVEGVGYGLDELTVTAFVPPDQTTDAGAWRGEAGTTTATARERSRPRDAASRARTRGRTRGRARRNRASAAPRRARRQPLGGSAQRGRRPRLTPRPAHSCGVQSWTPCVTSRARRATTRASRASVSEREKERERERGRAAGLAPAAPAAPRPLTLTLTLAPRRDTADLVAFQQA